MFKRILVAVDSSEYSRQAVPTAIEIAKKFDADVFVLHVNEHDLGRAAAYPRETEADAAEIVAGAIKSIRDAGVTVEGEVRIAFLGDAPNEIVETAAIQGADLIVMGSRGLSDVAGLFLGSVTHKVIKLAKIPVLVDRSAAPVELAAAAAAGAASV
jgi:nucleotide-binding universal stress UspA family protein